jgi:hypothetical protein
MYKPDFARRDAQTVPWLSSNRGWGLVNAAPALYMIIIMMSPELSELSDYQAYEKTLSEQLEGFIRLRRQVRWFPLFAIVTGVPVGLFTRGIYGAAVVLIWLIFWSSTLYITAMRSWQYAGERKRIQREIQELERAAAAPGASA